MEKTYELSLYLTENEYLLLQLALDSKIRKLKKKPKTEKNLVMNQVYKKMKKHLMEQMKTEKIFEELKKEIL